jgi:hypothetical protein
MQFGAPSRFEDRCREKQISRQNDEARLASGEISAAELNRANGFFSPLFEHPGVKVKLLVRRARVRIDDK